MNLIAISLLSFFGLTGFLQTDQILNEIKAYQQKLNADYKTLGKSPLEAKARKKFKGHNFFEIDLKYRVVAKFERLAAREVYKMNTSTTRIAEYQKYAIATFQLDGVEHKLTLFKSESLSRTPGYENYLFLPFTDATTGNTTYGAGRYLDVQIPEGNEIIIDFNRAYNPYCAYSDNYSCPRVPEENTLSVEIKAGVSFSNKH